MTHRKNKKLSPYTVVGILVLCGVLCGSMVYKTISLKAESARYLAQIAELKKEEKSLKEEKKSLEDYKSYVNSREYAEEVARDKLGLVYPGEIIFEPDDRDHRK